MNYNIAFIGKSISHSILPQIYARIGQQIARKIIVDSIEINEASLADILLKPPLEECHATCITFPYKTDALKQINRDILTPRAISSGSINIIKYENMTPVLSDNTDGQGFVHDAVVNKHISFTNKNILILGAGGTVRGVLASLVNLEPRTLTICNRNIAKSNHLARELKHIPLRVCDYFSIPRLKYDIIINATSASINGELPLIPLEIVNQDVICLECAYKYKGITPFGQWARNAGVASYFDGIGMLIEQAAEAIKILLDISVDTKHIIKEFSN